MAYRKTYEVTGYTFNAAAYCPDHKPQAPDDEIGVIFLGDEWDGAPTCDVCHVEIECVDLSPSRESDRSN